MKNFHYRQACLYFMAGSINQVESYCARYRDSKRKRRGSVAGYTTDET